MPMTKKELKAALRAVVREAEAAYCDHPEGCHHPTRCDFMLIEPRAITRIVNSA